jgi:hypothetical protein
MRSLWACLEKAIVLTKTVIDIYSLATDNVGSSGVVICFVFSLFSLCGKRVDQAFGAERELLTQTLIEIFHRGSVMKGQEEYKP